MLYDADCGFCKWSLGKVLAWDRRHRLRPVAIQSAEGERLLAPMPKAERLASWHLVLPAGEVRSGGAAAAPLARLLPCGRPFAALFETFPRITERAYGWVADHRSQLARLVRARPDQRLRR